MRSVQLGMALLVLAAPAVEAQDSTVARLYRAGVEAAETGNLASGIAAMDSVVAIEPGIPNAHWNLGLWHSALEQPDAALRSWLAYRRLNPDDWHVRAKLVQAYQALGDSVARNDERAALLALRAAGSDSTMARFDEWCREQFRVGTHQVMAFETFEPRGDRRVFLTFYVADSAGQMLGHYSLGSYDFTTRAARETGDIGPRDRIYHLDWYAEGFHATVMFFRRMPSYEEARTLAVEALSGRRAPVSSSRRE